MNESSGSKGGEGDSNDGDEPPPPPPPTPPSRGQGAPQEDKGVVVAAVTARALPHHQYHPPTSSSTSPPPPSPSLPAQSAVPCPSSTTLSTTTTSTLTPCPPSTSHSTTTTTTTTDAQQSPVHQCSAHHTAQLHSVAGGTSARPHPAASHAQHHAQLLDCDRDFNSHQNSSSTSGVVAALDGEVQRKDNNTEEYNGTLTKIVNGEATGSGVCESIAKGNGRGVGHSAISDRTVPEESASSTYPSVERDKSDPTVISARMSQESGEKRRKKSESGRKSEVRESDARKDSDRDRGSETANDRETRTESETNKGRESERRKESETGTVQRDTKKSCLVKESVKASKVSTTEETTVAESLKNPKKDKASGERKSAIKETIVEGESKEGKSDSEEESVVRRKEGRSVCEGKESVCERITVEEDNECVSQQAMVARTDTNQAGKVTSCPDDLQPLPSLSLLQVKHDAATHSASVSSVPDGGPAASVSNSDPTTMPVGSGAAPEGGPMRPAEGSVADGPLVKSDSSVPDGSSPSMPSEGSVPEGVLNQTGSNVLDGDIMNLSDSSSVTVSSVVGTPRDPTLVDAEEAEGGADDAPSTPSTFCSDGEEAEEGSNGTLDTPQAPHFSTHPQLKGKSPP